MEFIKSLFNLFQEDEDITDDGPSDLETTKPQDFNLDDILTSQSESLSDDVVDDIATEMLHELDSSQLVNYFDENDDNRTTAPDILDLDAYEDIFDDVNNNEYENSPTNSLDDIKIETLIQTSDSDKEEVAKDSQDKVNTKDFIEEDTPSIAFNENIASNDHNVPDSTINDTETEDLENSEINTDTNIENSEINLDDILNSMYVSESIYVNENIDTVIEKLNTEQANIFQVTKSKGVSNITSIKLHKEEICKITNDFNKDNHSIPDIKETDKDINLPNSKDPTHDDKVSETMVKSIITNIIDNNINNENIEKEKNKEQMNTNNKVFEVKFEESIEIEITNMQEHTTEVPVEYEPKNETPNEINAKIVTKINQNEAKLKIHEKATFEEINVNTDWEKLIDKVTGIIEIEDSDIETADDKTALNNLEKQHEAAAAENDQMVDTISISSDSCVIQDSDYCSGYHSSDFEFITESDAENDGFIVDVTNKRFKRNENELDCRDIVPIEFNNENTASISSNDASLTNERNKTRYSINDPNRDYSYANHVRYLPNLEFDNNLEHRIPEGDAYLNLFRGLYAPIMTTQMFFMENKSIITPKSMDANFHGLGFDLRRMIMVDDADEECRQEAEETLDKIIEMYPGANRKRRRLRHRQRRQNV